jgi:hypothetical protein
MTMKKATQRIIDVLSKYDPDMVDKFREIIAMARSRQDARQEINAQSLPLFKHLIPFVIMRNNNIIPPKNWVDEINAFLIAIDSKNRKKNKQWFSAKEIQNILNGLLDSTPIKKIIYNKLEPFPIKESVKKGIDDFFENNPPTLEKLNIEFKYVPSEEGKELALFLNGIKVE